ncbi:sirohydrochlorin cobaltochelatase [Aminiphilus sp.]|uniref:sirohydrochlorin cobaltochelatase n=1 Tax=Aminiphilus sp. TaxID=1872488 RepID=UPI0026158AD4|nr:sirohydrochlorin cobaltochelatase [Aminiphilus sp.]
MTRSGLVLLCCALFLAAFSSSEAFAMGHGKAAPEKKGILVVAFGTSVPEARSAIDTLVDAARKAFPDAEVRTAYTSNIIRRKVLAEEGTVIDSPLIALARMQDEGFTHVVVQPTHVIRGEEFDDLAEVTDALARLERKYSFKAVAMGDPFLSSFEDYGKMVSILQRTYGDRAKGDGAVVFMGHGSPHPANAAYSQMQLLFDERGLRFALGTVEGFPSLDMVLERLETMGAKRVTLVPFMIVAGDHARNDMADPEDPESWRSVLESKGYRVNPVIEGLGSNPEVAALFVEHLRVTAQHVF